MIRYLGMLAVLLLLSALADRYRDNLVIVPPDPHPCWTANETLEHVRQLYDEYGIRDMVDDRFEGSPQITHPGYLCDERGEFTGDLLK